MNRSNSKTYLRLVLIVSILASFVAFLDSSIVNVALPAIMRELGGGLSLQQWTVDAYLVTLGGLILIAGSLSDLFGCRRILRWGLIGFGVSSLLCAVAPNGWFLIFARAIQGIGGALLVPSSLAMIISAFPDQAKGKAIGQWTAWTGIAFVVGPLLGGFLVDVYSWRYIFAINLLPIALTLWLTMRLHSGVVSKEVRVDSLGALLCVTGFSGVVYALIEQAYYGWTSLRIYPFFVLGVFALSIFIWYEHKVSNPMLPLKLFAIRNFSFGNLATVAVYGALSAAAFLITVFLQEVEGYAAINAGLSLLPITIIMFLLSPRFGMLETKYGPRVFMAFGPFLSAIGVLFLLRVKLPADYLTQILPGVLLFGLGLSATVAPLTAAVLGSISADRAGVGSAVNNAVARIAGLIAIAALSIFIGTTVNFAGFRRGIVGIATMLVVGSVISAIGIQNLRKLTPNR